MPPNGFTTITVSDETYDKLVHMMHTGGLNSIPSTVETAVNVTLAVAEELPSTDV